MRIKQKGCLWLANETAVFFEIYKKQGVPPNIAKTRKSQQNCRNIHSDGFFMFVLFQIQVSCFSFLKATHFESVQAIWLPICSWVSSLHLTARLEPICPLFEDPWHGNAWCFIFLNSLKGQMRNILDENPATVSCLDKQHLIWNGHFLFMHLSKALLQLLPLCVIPGDQTHDLDVGSAMLYQHYNRWANRSWLIHMVIHMQKAHWVSINVTSD